MPALTFEQARAEGPVHVIGVDTGPVNSAVVAITIAGRAAKIIKVGYWSNEDLSHDNFLLSRVVLALPCSTTVPAFLSYEHCGCQGQSVGDEVFETAMMCGEIRRAFRPHVRGTYALRPSEWRYMLCGFGSAKAKHVYAEFPNWFEKSGGGADPLKGNKALPGPLAALHEAGKGGNVEHLKDALGVALALDRIRYRCGRDPEEYRRHW